MTAPAAGSFARRIYDRCHLTGEFGLRSGASSDEYFDKYLFESDPKLLREIARALVQLLPEQVDAVAGLELGGVPLATVVSQLSGLPALFVRKQAKTYGTCRLAGAERLRDAAWWSSKTSSLPVARPSRRVGPCVSGAPRSSLCCACSTESRGAQRTSPRKGWSCVQPSR